MQCHAVPQPPLISGRSPEKELCFRTKQEREKHQDSVCVCARAHTRMGIHTCTHRHQSRLGGQEGTSLQPNEMIARRGHIQCLKRAQSRRNLNQPGGVREGFPEEAVLSWKDEGMITRCRKKEGRT